MKAKVCHVVAILNAGAPDDLVAAQEIALASLRTARDFADDGLDISIIGAHFSDEDWQEPGILSVPSLERSAPDLVPDGVGRRLPLLQEVLAALPISSDDYIAIYTNADIAVQPQFYRGVAALVAAGVDAGSITRRTVSFPPQGVDPLIWASMQVGDAHAGHDCLFFSSQLLQGIDVGRVTLGAANVMRPLLASLHMQASRFKVFTDLHMTFHLEDAQDWQQDVYTANSLFNSQETVAALIRLESVHGRGPLERFLVEEGFDPHPDTVMPNDVRALIASCQARREVRESLGSRLNRSTQPWPRLNNLVHRLASLKGGTGAG